MRPDLNSIDAQQIESQFHLEGLSSFSRRPVNGTPSQMIAALIPQALEVIDRALQEDEPIKVLGTSPDQFDKLLDCLAAWRDILSSAPAHRERSNLLIYLGHAGGSLIRLGAVIGCGHVPASRMEIPYERDLNDREWLIKTLNGLKEDLSLLMEIEPRWRAIADLGDAELQNKKTPAIENNSRGSIAL
ncbi:MAG: hypothetical protein J5J00_03540 [Deltaproteobacteria bacterium]|nr:hypothetical protein [Deltaproteobacteria bacterium]